MGQQSDLSTIDSMVADEMDPPRLVPSSDRVSRQMSELGQRDTAPEIAIRSELHRRGFRFRVHAKPEPDFRTKADIVFRSMRIVIYIDGCFWHACPQHGTIPVSNRKFWQTKLRRNRERDAENVRLLSERGWTVIRIWEHDDPIVAADMIGQEIRAAFESPRI